MKTFLLLFSIGLLFSGCDWAKEKTKDSIHKAGEIAAKTGSEFADGVKEGVTESFSNVVMVSDALSKAGVQVGRVIIKGTDSTTDNLVSVYLIFSKDYDGRLLAKAIDADGTEFGRSKVLVSAKADDAKFIDFVFDPRTNIDRNDKVTIE